MTLGNIGTYLIFTGLFAVTWSFLAGLAGGIKKDRVLAASAERGFYVATAAAILATFLLLYLQITNDYSIAYVWKYTSNSLGFFYKISALWAGQEGSLLLWLDILVLLSTVAILRTRSQSPALAANMIWILASVVLFFFLLLAFPASPFATLTEVYPESAGVVVHEGNGLNPSLQNPSMLIHPPVLYLGYVGFTIPFAFAMAAMVSGRLNTEWLRLSRIWTMFAWIFLSAGIMLGARWAYVELGWGGYWAWDPVENASLMPWLTGTAFLHSVMIEEKRGMLRRWNIFLILLTFLLSLFGTFLTRSGILSSVHSFAESDVGMTFIYFIGVWAFFGGLIFAWRWPELKARHKITSLFSREAAFLYQNLLLLGICLAVWWGTMYPIFSEWLSGEKVTVTSPYFNRVVLPIGLALYLLMGIGPVISWRHATLSNFVRNLGVPFIGGIAVAGLALVIDRQHLASAAGFGLAAFVVLATLRDVHIAALVRGKNTGESLPLACLRLFDRNRRRYGGFLAHIGMAVLLVGIAGTAYNQEKESYMVPGEKLAFGEYTVQYNGNTTGNDGHRDIYRADITLMRGDLEIEVVDPEISIYFPGQRKEERNSEVSILNTAWHALYFVLADVDGPNATLRVMRHPLVSFIWLGAILVVLGGIAAIIPRPKSSTVRAAALLVPLLLLTSTAHAQYSDAIGNRDPVSEELICLCGCRMLLSECDHTTCGSRPSQLASIANLRAAGLDPDAIIEEMVALYGSEVRAAPPQRGWHMLAWFAPGTVILLASLGLLVYIRTRPDLGPQEETSDELSAEDLAEADKALKDWEDKQ